jgi:hypothetical protein
MITFVKRDTISDESVTKLNYLGQNKLNKIVLINGNVFNESFFEIRNDSIFITDSNSEILNAFPTAYVKRIIYKDRIIGMGYGAFWGIFTSFVLFSGGGLGPVPLIIGTGILAGGTLGYIDGSDQCYEFKE